MRRSRFEINEVGERFDDMIREPEKPDPGEEGGDLEESLRLAHG